MYTNVQFAVCDVSLKFACERAQPIHLVAHWRKTGAAKFTRSQDISGATKFRIFTQDILEFRSQDISGATKFRIFTQDILDFRSQDISGAPKSRIFTRHMEQI